MPAKIAFWDTSAIIPLFCNQAASRKSRLIRRSCNELVFWWGTHVEVHSGINRLLNEVAIRESQSLAAISKWDQVYATSLVVKPTEAVLNMAVLLTSKMNIRALDAFQLAAALAWCNERPRNRPFICSDKRLSVAAKEAGFDVIEIG